MGVLTKIFTLPFLIKVLEKTGRPLFCAILYTCVILSDLLLDFMLSKEAVGVLMPHAALMVVASFVMSYPYFFLLKDLDGSGAPYWGVLVGGLVLIIMWPN